MESVTRVCLVALTLVVSVASQGNLNSRVETTTVFSLKPRSTTGFESCTTKKGAPGKCVHWSYCNNGHEIETHGVIDDSELRSLECKNEKWCCSDKNITKPTPPKTRKPDSPSACIVSDRPDCPWCVHLYREAKDFRVASNGFFCMGTLISTKVILTSGTCMIQSKNNKLWVRIPGSSDPNKNFTVQYRLLHDDYNSGTRENDLALLTIDPEVEWDKRGPKGACLDLQPTSLQGDCIGAGIDDDDNVNMTPLLVAKGTCGRGSPNDAACGNAIGDDCAIVPGAPIMCRANNGPFIVTGLAKLPCMDDPPKALLNNLVLASNWVNSHLKGTMGLQENDYLKLNT